MNLKNKLSKAYASRPNHFVDTRWALLYGYEDGFDAAIKAVLAELALMMNVRRGSDRFAFEQGVFRGLEYAKDIVERLSTEELLGNPEESEE